MKTLKKFLKKRGACDEGYEFAKDLTLEQFLKTCKRADWILWLFRQTNGNDLAKLTEAKALCANTVRHLMTNEKSTNALDVAFKFAKGQATREELKAAAAAAYSASISSADLAAYAAASISISPMYAAIYSTASKKGNQRLVLDICRKVLPLQIWNQEDF